MDVSTQLHVQSCVFRGMAVILCDHNFALRCLSLSICFPPLSAVYYFLLRSVLCRRFFFLLTAPLTTALLMKYASNYFFFVRCLFACLSCITPLPQSVSARAFSPHIFSSRVAVSPGSDIFPSLSHHLVQASPRLAPISTTNRRHYVTQIDTAPPHDVRMTG